MGRDWGGVEFGIGGLHIESDVWVGLGWVGLDVRLVVGYAIRDGCGMGFVFAAGIEMEDLW